MDNLVYLFIAYVAIWTGLFIFMLQIGKKLTQQQRDIANLKEELNCLQQLT